MKQRRTCVPSVPASVAASVDPSDNGGGGGDDNGVASSSSSSSLSPTAAAATPTAATPTAATPTAADWSAFKQWSDEEERNAAVRERLRRLLLPTGTRECGGDDDDGVGKGVYQPPNSDDAVDRGLLYDVLCCDASTRLLRVASTLETARRSSASSSSVWSTTEYAAVVNALVSAARMPTLTALGRHLVARAISWRPPGAASVAASRGECAIATMPLACLALAIEYTKKPWRLAAVCRQWWRCVRDTPLRLSHHAEFALQRLDAYADVTFSAQASASRSMRFATAVAERASVQDAERAQVEREIFTRTVPTCFRARTTDVKFRAAVFRSVPAVAHFLVHLVALQKIEIALRLDDARDDAGTAPLDVLDRLPHLGTLRLALAHRLDRPADFDMHVPRLPSLTHLDCRTHALKARRSADDSTDAPTLHIRCKSLRVLRLSGRGRGDRARAAAPRIAWEDAQALEGLSLNFGDSETDTGEEYELAFWAQCVDVDATDYDRQAGREFADVQKSTRFARSMQRLRRLAIAGHFCLSSPLAALEALRLRVFVGHQERVWPTLTAVRAIRGRIDFMSDAVALALHAPPNVTHVDLDVRTAQATAPQIEAMREFAARLEAARGALTWNGSATFPAFRVTEDEQETREDGDSGDSGDENEFSDTADAIE